MLLVQDAARRRAPRFGRGRRPAEDVVELGLRRERELDGGLGRHRGEVALRLLRPRAQRLRGERRRRLRLDLSRGERLGQLLVRGAPADAAPAGDGVAHRRRRVQLVAGGVVHAVGDPAAVRVVLEERGADGRDGDELLGVDAIEQGERQRLGGIVEIDHRRAGAVVDDEIVAHREEDRARRREAVRGRQRGGERHEVVLDVGVERQRRRHVDLAVVAEERVRRPRHHARVARGRLHHAPRGPTGRSSRRRRGARGANG